MNLEAYFTPYIKTNSIWIICISAKVKVTAFSRKQENIVATLEQAKISERGHQKKKNSSKLFFIKI